MEKVVTKLVKDLSTEELEKIKSATEMVVLIVKIIERVHKKKKLSYDDSKRLVSLVIDTIVTTFKGTDISPRLNRVLSYLEQNKAMVETLVSEFIDVWHSVSDLCDGCNCCRGCTPFRCCGGCKKKKEPRVRKSIIERPHMAMVSPGDEGFIRTSSI